MPDPTEITVKLFDLKLSEDSPFLIEPGTLSLPKMLESYQVTFTLDTAIPGAQLIAVGQTAHSARPAHVTETLLPNGNLQVTFTPPANPMILNVYNYEVAVQLANGTILISPDPEIEILPGP